MMLSHSRSSSALPVSPLYHSHDLASQQHDKENRSCAPTTVLKNISTSRPSSRSRSTKPSTATSSSLHPRSHSATRRLDSKPSSAPYARPSSSSHPTSPKKKRTVPAKKASSFAPRDAAALIGAAPLSRGVGMVLEDSSSSQTLASGSAGPVVYDRGTALLPLSLPRPSRMAFIDTSTVEGIEGVPFTYVQERLALEGPNLLQSALAAQLVPPSGPNQTLAPPLPSTLTFSFISSTSTSAIPSTLSSSGVSIPPNFCLAVRQTPHFPTSSGPVTSGTILPIHDLVYRTTCAHLPIIPSRDVSLPAEELPLIHITLPSPSTLPILNTFLYTQRTDILLSSLLNVPAGLGNPTPTSRSGLTELLAGKVDLKGLMERIARVHGLWSNTCSLGVAMPSLWKAMDTAWEVLVGAVAIVQIRNGLHARQQKPTAQPTSAAAEQK